MHEPFSRLKNNSRILAVSVNPLALIWRKLGHSAYLLSELYFLTEVANYSMNAANSQLFCLVE